MALALARRALTEALLRRTITCQHVRVACAGFASQASGRGGPRAGRPAPSSTDKNFSLEDFIASSDDEAKRGATTDKSAGASAKPRGQQDRRGGQRFDRGSRGGPGGQKRPHTDRRAPAGEGAAAAAEEAAAQATPAVEETPTPPPEPAGPRTMVVVDRDGDIMLAGDNTPDASGRKPQEELTQEEHRAAMQQFAHYRRRLRATYDDVDLELYADALAREVEHDLPASVSDMTEMRTPREYTFGEDPLDRMKLPFNLHALKFKTHLSWNAPPGTRNLDRRAVLRCRVGELGLDAKVATYVRAVAGGHYDADTDGLTISVDKHEDAALNKRETIEQLVALVTQSKELSAKYGPFQKTRRLPPYSH